MDCAVLARFLFAFLSRARAEHDSCPSAGTYVFDALPGYVELPYLCSLL